HDEDEHHDEEEELTNTKGFIGNSDAESEGYTFGASFSGDRGFIGFSISEIENNYGLPPGAHGGHHDEHGHDDDEEHHDDDEEHHDDEEEHHDEEEGHHDEGEHEEEGEEFVRIDMEQTRYDLKGELNFDSGFIQKVRGAVNYTDYEHQEIEFEGDGTAFIGTTFANEGYEGRITMNHAPINNWQGVWGLQFSDTEFSAIGEEAFIPEIDSTGYALFLVERLELEDITWELGYRYEFREHDAGMSCDRDEGANSLSASLLYDFSEASNILVAASRSERSPTLEERFANVQSSSCSVATDPEEWVTHVATGLLELGDPDLDKEVSTNIEFGFHSHSERLETELNVYYNQIDDYIYLADGGEFEETPIAVYTAEDAAFYGLEGKVVYQAFENEYGSLDLSLQGDLVRAEFDSAGDVPRIPPDRIGVGLTWHGSNWTFSTNLTEVADQDQTAIGEFETDGYTLLDVYTDIHFKVGQGELLLFAKGSNLLDEEIRNHTSYLKNYAPEPGRGVRVGLRFNY
ncbi:MAG: TonB-dependent receptor, partial [Pseudomonadales bacterium]|nr:TonB-dependent receptor [Pseudomonadales bacterium]